MWRKKFAKFERNLHSTGVVPTVSLYSGETPVEWQKTTLEIVGSSFVESRRTYDENTCSNAPIKTVTVDAHFVLGAAVDKNGYPHTQIDFTLNSVTANPSGGGYPSSGTIYKRLAYMGAASSYSGFMLCNSTPINALSFTGVGSIDGVVLGGDSVDYPTSVNTFFFMK